MTIPLSNPDTIDEKKALFVEEQAKAYFEFSMQTREILRTETHTTFQWLLALVIAPSGYIVTLMGHEEVAWWLIWPLLAVVLAAAWFAIDLLLNAMRLVTVIPAGNLPSALANDTVFAYSADVMRLGAACQLQERINVAREHNDRVGNAINRARYALATIPVIGAILGVAIRALTGVF
jgi:hypothetical protein